MKTLHRNVACLLVLAIAWLGAACDKLDEPTQPTQPAPPAVWFNGDNGDDDDDDNGLQRLFLADNKVDFVTARNPGNRLDKSAPNGPGAVYEPDAIEAAAGVWKSAPLTRAHFLLPGTVTLNLVLKNYSENVGPIDVCYSKRIAVAGAPAILVATGCFENTFPAVGAGTCPPTTLMGASPPPPGCFPQGVLTMPATSTILAPTLIPAGAVEELRIWCPGASFIGAFWNDEFEPGFSTLVEPKCPVEDDDDNDGANNKVEFLLGLLLNDSDSDDDGILDGNDDGNGNGFDDEDEDDDDECPDLDSDGDGEDDEDEDD